MASSKIKNLGDLAATPLRRAALAIAEAGLEAIDTEKVICESVRIEKNRLFVKGEVLSLESIRRVFVVGVGKCSLEAGKALEGLLGERLNGGIVVGVHPVRGREGPQRASASNGVHKGKLKKIKTFQGTHPLPTEINMAATKEIIALLEGCKEDDFIIFVISGGGSTLLCSPAEVLTKEGQPTKLTCEEEAEIFRCLSAAGADIKEINTLRKHISLARGGNLAKYAYPAKSVALIFSDVPGDGLEFVASGPTVKDTTTILDAERIVNKYDLAGKCGFPAGAIIETPKEGKYFANVRNILLVSGHTALKAMAEKAKELGFAPRIVTATLSGEAKEAGKKIAGELAGTNPKTAFLYGGETTVTLRNPNGKGGRNQELALSALAKLGAGQIVLAVASDGRDNSDHGGAICDKITSEKAKKLRLDPEEFLGKNNSYEFFKKTGDYLELGDTGSNVSDLIVALNN